MAAGEEWRRLTTVDKAPYELRAEEERRKYEQAMKEYNMVCTILNWLQPADANIVCQMNMITSYKTLIWKF